MQFKQNSLHMECLAKQASNEGKDLTAVIVNSKWQEQELIQPHVSILYPRVAVKSC